MSIISLVDVSRAQRDVMASFETGKRRTYLLGHLGKQALRSHLMLGGAVANEAAELVPNRAEVLVCARRLDDGIGCQQVDGIRDGCGWARRLMGLARSAWPEPWRDARRGGAVR